MTRRRLSLLLVSLVVVAASPACTGDIGHAIGRGGAGSAPDGDDEPVTPELCAELPPDLGAAPLRRLTRAEYDATVLALLEDDSHPADAFPEDETLLGFAAAGVVSPVMIELYQAAAETLAATARERLDAMLTCDTADDACARTFLDAFGRRAYRRPLEASEVDALLELYRGERTAGEGFDSAIELCLTAILQSPHFLYRVELGEPGDGPVLRLTQHEVATRLSYLLWGTMPDETLAEAADAGALASGDQIEDQARRMIDDPRAHEAVGRFYDEWMELSSLDDLSKDETAWPTFAADHMGEALHESTRAFVDGVIWDGDARLETLLTSPTVFVDDRIADLLGWTGEAGAELAPVELDSGERAGLLTQPGVMAIAANADQSSPIYRGKLVRERVLCQNLSDPPDTLPDGTPLVIVPPEVTDDMSTRERFAAHTDDPFCAGCHRMIDGIGFGLEKFDAVGRFRPTERVRGVDVPVDTTGTIYGTRDDGDVSYDGARELAQYLAGSEQVHECVANQWFRYAFGRAESAEDACSLNQLYGSFAASDHDLRELVIALTRTDAFSHVRIGTEEVQP